MKNFYLRLMVIIGVFFLFFSCSTAKKDRAVSLIPVDVIVPEEMEKAYEVKELKKEELQEKEQSNKNLALKSSSKFKQEKNIEKKLEKNIKKELKKNKKEEFVIPNRRPKKDPLWVGEKLVMDVSWLRTRGGEFTLEVLPFKEMNNRKVYHVKASAKTADFFKWIYRAEDYVESFFDYEGWIPYKFILKGDETKVIRNYLELYDHAQKKQYIHIINHKVKTGEFQEDKGYKDLIPFSQDSISALYYARTLDLNVGQKYRFPMTANGRQWDTELVILGKEEIDTKAGVLKTIKTQVYTYFNGVIEQKGDSFLWFTDDDRKLPVKFDAKVKIGWVTGVVKSIDWGTPPSQDSK
jgi:hypothetical protein